MAQLADNRKAWFDYEILETYKAGISLFGFEVKAARAGKAQLVGSFVLVRGGEVFWVNGIIAPYQQNNTPKSYHPDRARKLLLTKKEIAELAGKTSHKGLTLMPLSLYTERRKIKLEIGLARSRRKYEKREAIKKREFGKERKSLMSH